MSIKAQFVSGSLWVVVGTGLNNLASFAVFAVLARLLDPSAIGLVALAMVVIDLSRVIVFGGIPEAVVQRPDWDEGLASSCAWANLAVSLAVAVALAFAGGPIAAAIYGDEAGSVLAALAAVLIVDAIRAVPEAKLRREFAYKKLASRGALATLISGVVGIVVAFAGFGIWALVWQRWLSAVMTTLLTVYAAQWLPRPSFSLAHLRSVSGFIFALTPARLITVLNMRVPELVLGFMLGPAAVGVFRVGARTLEAVGQLTTQPIQRAALSAFSRLGTPAAIGQGIVRVTRVSAILSCPAYFGAAATAPDLILVVFGPQWKEAAVVMSLLAIGVGATTLASQVQPALTAAGRTDLVLTSTIGSFLATVASSFATVWWGPSGVAAGQSVRAYISLPFWLHLLYRGVGVRWKVALQGLGPPFVAAVVMALGVVGLRIYILPEYHTVLRIILCIISGLFLYISLLLIFGRKYIRIVIQELKPLLPKIIKNRLPD